MPIFIHSCSRIIPGTFQGLCLVIHNLFAGFPQQGGFLSTGCSQPVILAVVSEDVIARVDEVVQGLKQVVLALWHKIKRG